MRFVKVLLFIIIISTFAAPAMARYLGNPIVRYYPKKMQGVLSSSWIARVYEVEYTNKNDSTTLKEQDVWGIQHVTFSMDMGMAMNDALRFELGTIDMGFKEFNAGFGPEAGVGYHKRFKNRIKLGKMEITLGLFGGAHIGQQSAEETSISSTEFEGGFGASLALNRQHNVYLAPLFSYHSITIESPDASYKMTSSNPVGAYAGWDWAYDKNRTILFGGELHFLSNSGYEGYDLPVGNSIPVVGYTFHGRYIF